jgi:hypothetical protein
MPTGNDYLAIRYINTTGFDFFGNGAGLTTECSASFSGSAAIFHAVSSSQGTYTWDSDTGEITLNSDGNYYIHGTLVAETDGSDTTSDKNTGFMGVSASAAAVTGFPYFNDNADGVVQATKLGARGLKAMGLLVDFGPNIPASSRGGTTPRSHPYQMLLKGVVAGTVIKPTFRNISSHGTPIGVTSATTFRNIRLRQGTSIIVQNFPSDDLEQSFAFSHVNYTASARPALANLALENDPHWLAGTTFSVSGATTARSSSFGFDFNALDPSAVSAQLDLTGTFSASSDLQAASLTGQKYIITSLQGLGGPSTTGAPASSNRWNYWQPSSYEMFNPNFIYSAKIGTGEFLSPRVSSRTARTGFAANMGNTAIHMIDVPHTTIGGDPVYGMTCINPITAQRSADSYSSNVVTQKLPYGEFLTGSSFAIIPMAPYSTEAKADSYFSVNLVAYHPKNEDRLNPLNQLMSIPVKFLDGNGHVNMWRGNNEPAEVRYGAPMGTGSFFGWAQTILPGGVLEDQMTTGSSPLEGVSLQTPAEILTSSGITPDFDEGKLTVNYDGMYVLKQTWNSVALSASTDNSNDLTITIRKNATSGTFTPSGNYLAGGISVYESTVQIDHPENCGYTGISTICAFTASAGDYFTCDVSGVVSGFGDDEMGIVSAGGLSLTMYRIGEIPGFSDASISGSGLDLFNRDLSVINRYSVSNQYTTSSGAPQVPFILGSRGITTIRDRSEPPAPLIGKREIIRKKRR